MKLRTFVAAVVVALVAPATALPQALTSLSTLRVGYSTRKNTVKPQGDLKAQIDALDAQIAEATRFGRNSELRRLYARGVALLNGQPWTDEADFAASLVVRTSNVVADSTKPLVFRLEQIYSPSLNLAHPLTANVTLRKRPVPPVPGGAPAALPEIVKGLGTFDGVGRDLRESPYLFEADVHDVADGGYQLAVDVLNDATLIGTASLNIALRKGLDETIARLENEAKRALPNVRAEILFPIDRMRNVNRGRLELRTFDPERDFAAAEAMGAVSKSGKDPFAGRTGDLKRHYTLEAAAEILPYRIYVPSAYTGTKELPLIVALHGLGGTEDAFFDNYERKLPPLAEQHGYNS
jgi:hypothetical protein